MIFLYIFQDRRCKHLQADALPVAELVAFFECLICNMSFYGPATLAIEASDNPLRWRNAVIQENQ